MQTCHLHEMTCLPAYREPPQGDGTYPFLHPSPTLRANPLCHATCPPALPGRLLPALQPRLLCQYTNPLSPYNYALTPGLLDYEDVDDTEAQVELAVLAESLHELLMESFGTNIAQALCSNRWVYACVCVHVCECMSE